MAPTVPRPERDFLVLSDVTLDEWQALWKRAAVLKAARARGEVTHTLAGRSVALVFDKASTRTRVSFEVGVFDLGGHAVVMTAQGSQIAAPAMPQEATIDKTAFFLNDHISATAQLPAACSTELADFWHTPVYLWLFGNLRMPDLMPVSAQYRQRHAPFC